MSLFKIIGLWSKKWGPPRLAGHRFAAFEVMSVSRRKINWRPILLTVLIILLGYICLARFLRISRALDWWAYAEMATQFPPVWRQFAFRRVSLHDPTASLLRSYPPQAKEEFGRYGIYRYYSGAPTDYPDKEICLATRDGLAMECIANSGKVWRFSFFRSEDPEFERQFERQFVDYWKKRRNVALVPVSEGVPAWVSNAVLRLAVHFPGTDSRKGNLGWVGEYHMNTPAANTLAFGSRKGGQIHAFSYQFLGIRSNGFKIMLNLRNYDGQSWQDITNVFLFPYDRPTLTTDIAGWIIVGEFIARSNQQAVWP